MVSVAVRLEHGMKRGTLPGTPAQAPWLPEACSEGPPCPPVLTAFESESGDTPSEGESSSAASATGVRPWVSIAP
jgi:hypothetical protein